MNYNIFLYHLLASVTNISALSLKEVLNDKVKILLKYKKCIYVPAQDFFFFFSYYFKVHRISLK